MRLDSPAGALSGRRSRIIAEMRFARAAALISLTALAAMAWSTPAAATGTETFRYQWQLDGFFGAIASLFFPSGGEGLLSIETKPEGILRGELLVTSNQSAKGDYFRYGAEWEAASGRTLRAWSDQVWRGEEKSKNSEVEDGGVIDIVSGIHLLRHDPPSLPRRMEIWSDGHLYPVLVLPRGTETRRLDGHGVSVKHLEIRGYQVPDRRLWKGELHLYIADDPEHTPVEIQVARRGVRVRLTFVDHGAGAASAAPPPPGGLP